MVKVVMIESDYLFVYGTLKSDATNTNAKQFHEQAELIGAARWQGSLHLVTNYPAAVISKNKDEFVFGELWQLKNPEQVLSLLDKYEECAISTLLPHEYERSVEFINIDQKIIPAWVYLYQLSTTDLPRIKTGIFINENHALIRRS